MSRGANFAIFISIALSILGLAHWYVWARLVAAPALPPGARRAFTVAFVALFLAVPLTFVVARTGNDGGLRRALTYTGYIWIGALFILFTLVGGLDLVRGTAALVQRLVADVPPEDPGRRVTVARLVALGTALLGGGLTALAVRSALGPVAVKEVRVRLPRLPAALHGTTIVQLSDVHVGPTIARDFVEDLVRRVNELGADVVAITGDLVDGSVAALREHVAPLRDLRAKHGVFFVTGNHEFYSGAESWCRELASLGIRVLRNEHVTIGSEGAAFDLAGVEDYSAGRFGKPSDVKRALAGRDPARPAVLLAHQPRSAFEADKLGVGLQLSGHTHGGQIWPWRYLVYLQQPVVSGLGQVGQTQVYVSSGTGYWGPPMRLGAPAEITKIVLESA